MTATIVTMYFEIKSKFPAEQYHVWQQTFLEHCRAPMVIFTDKQSAARICRYRKVSPLPLDDGDKTGPPDRLRIAARSTNTLVVVLELEDLPLSAEFMDYFRWCHEMDPERNVHTPELYLIWNCKPFLMEWVASHPLLKNPFSSKWLVYTDIGCCREMTPGDLLSLQSFPHTPLLDREWPEDKMVLHSINPFQEADKTLDSHTGLPLLFTETSLRDYGVCVRIQAGFFGCHIHTIPQWTCAYRDMLKTFQKSRAFGGKDQHVFGAIALTHPHLVQLIQVPQQDWFWFRKRWSAMWSPLTTPVEPTILTTTRTVELTETRAFYINIDRQPERRKSMETLVNVWFPLFHERISGVCHAHLPVTVNLCLSQVRLIERALQLCEKTGQPFTPFVSLEDDCVAWDGKVDVKTHSRIVFPADADAVYLGISQCGIDPHQARYLEGDSVIREKIDPLAGYTKGLFRTHNMLSMHAILILTPRYARATMCALMEAATQQVTCDTVVARLGDNYNVYALGDPPLFYQSAHLNGQEAPTKITWDNSNARPSVSNAIVPLTLLI